MIKISSNTTTEDRLKTVRRMVEAKRMITSAERHAMVHKFADEGDFRRAGELELGMIQMRSAYNGLCWNVLVPDHLKMGEQRIYSAYSQTVPAISVSPVTASAPIVRASLTRVVAQPGRITSQFEIPYADFMLSAQDPLAYFENNAVWDVNMAMDYQLLVGLNTAVQLASSTLGADYGPTQVASSTLAPEVLTSAFGKMAQNRQRPYAVLMNPQDYMASVPTWSGVVTSIAYKDSLLDQIGENDWVSDGWQPDFMGVHMFTSMMIPQGTVYVVVQPSALGYMPIYGDIFMTDNPSKTDQAIMAMTVNCFMGVNVINCAGVTQITLGSGDNLTAVSYLSTALNDRHEAHKADLKLNKDEKADDKTAAKK